MFGLSSIVTVAFCHLLYLYVDVFAFGSRAQDAEYLIENGLDLFREGQRLVFRAPVLVLGDPADHL